MKGYAATFRGEPKGLIFKVSGRWRWERPAGGIETYGRKSTLITVRAHIARLCRGTLADVKLERREGI